MSTGCATLFLNWLHYELGYSWRQIINAGGATLGATYANLTSRPNGFFTQVLARFPAGTPCGLTGDNPFPLWSQFTGFNLVGQSYLWAHDPSTGLVAILAVNPVGGGIHRDLCRALGHRLHQLHDAGGTGFTQTADVPVWDTGYTAFAPIQFGGYVWALTTAPSERVSSRSTRAGRGSRRHSSTPRAEGAVVTANVQSALRPSSHRPLTFFGGMPGVRHGRLDGG